MADLRAATRKLRAATRRLEETIARLEAAQAGRITQLDRLEARLLLGDIERGLECAECRRWSWADDRGWRAYLIGDESPAVAIFCPDCSSD